MALWVDDRWALCLGVRPSACETRLASRKGSQRAEVVSNTLCKQPLSSPDATTRQMCWERNGDRDHGGWFPEEEAAKMC